MSPHTNLRSAKKIKSQNTNFPILHIQQQFLIFAQQGHPHIVVQLFVLQQAASSIFFEAVFSIV